MRYCFMRFPGGKDRALTLSYDDGSTYDKKLIEIADKYKIKVTLNINSELLGEKSVDWHLSVEELKELIANGGHEIAIHGARHIAPGRVAPVTGIRDALDCRRDLERIFGRIIRGMAYPDCGITRMMQNTSKEAIKSYLSALGIAYARSLEGDNDRFWLPNDWYEWIPTAHHNNPKLMEYLDKFLKKQTGTPAHRVPKLFYMWGHSFEFEKNQNWDLFETFCSKAGGHEDVWYATNIEIYDYTQAYYSLQFNVDNTLVYNPTLYDIWFEADGEMFCVKSGETLSLT